MAEEVKTKVEEKKMEETKLEEKVETKKPAKKVEKKIHDKAIANAYSLKISPKYAKFVCRMISRKSPDAAIARLQEVIDEKRAVPMAGLEVAHQKGKGLAGAKFPKNACKEIMEVVKQARANAMVNDIDNQIIAIARSDQAAAPFRRAGRKAKRTHMYIEIRDKVKMMEAKK